MNNSDRTALINFGNKPKRASVYWLVENNSKETKIQMVTLQNYGYSIEIFNNLEQLIEVFSNQRSSVLVISSADAGGLLLKWVSTISNLPEMHSVRKILCLGQHSEQATKIAACGNFRDIIPLKLEPEYWFSRFRYSTASEAISISHPLFQINKKDRGFLYLPSRVTSLEKNIVSIESNVGIPVEQKISLQGNLVDKLGKDNCTINVRSYTNTDLTYRFSANLKASLFLDREAHQKLTNLNNELKTLAARADCRIYLALQTPDTRNEILRQLDTPGFKLKVALTRKQMIMDPKYFSPDFYIIEDKILAKNPGTLEKIVNNLPHHTLVYILGNLDLRNKIQRSTIAHKIVFYKSIPNNIHALILKRLQDRPVNEDLVNVDPESSYSNAEIFFPVSLSSIHPLGGSLDSKYPLTNYTLATIRTPTLSKLFNRTPCLKISHTLRATGSGEHKYRYQFFWSDLDRHERAILAKHLALDIERQLKAS